MEESVYQLKGARGRSMDVYPDKCVIRTKVGIGSFLSGNVTDGEKTIYYVDCIGVQFKKPSLTIGYLQLETASGLMNNKGSNFFNENTFTWESNDLNGTMEEVYQYVKRRVDKAKNPGASAPAAAAPALSVADELLKFKQLLDMGVLTQEEFDAKKKELLQQPMVPKGNDFDPDELPNL